MQAFLLLEASTIVLGTVVAKSFQTGVYFDLLILCG